MSLYLSKDTAFTNTANAIRNKLGTSLPLTWDSDDGFADDVNLITPAIPLRDKLIYFNDFAGHTITKSGYTESIRPVGSTLTVIDTPSAMLTAGCPYLKSNSCEGAGIHQYQIDGEFPGTGTTWGGWFSVPKLAATSQMIANVRSKDPFRLYKLTTSSSDIQPFKVDRPSIDYKIYNVSSTGQDPVNTSEYFPVLCHIACVFVSSRNTTTFSIYINSAPYFTMTNKTAADVLTALGIGRHGYPPTYFTGMFASNFALSQSEIATLMYNNFPWE